MALPTKPTSRVGMPPRLARVLLAGPPKAGKTTTLGKWAPKTTLIIDAQRGTDLLDGEHYVQHVRTWPDVVRTVNDICAGGHPFHTIGVDPVNDLWRMCDLFYGRKDRDTGIVFPATSQDDYGRSSSKARAGFTNVIGRLLAAPVGVWFIAHLLEKTDKEGKLTVYKPDLDKAIYSYIAGAVGFVWLTEAGPDGRSIVHTQPTQHFEAGSRGSEEHPVPSPLPLDAAELARALDRTLNPQDYDEHGKRKQPEPAAPETVLAAPAEVDPQVAPPSPKDIGHDPEATDVPAEDVWWTDTKALMEAAGVSGDELRTALAMVPGVTVPQKVASWQKLITGLDAEQRVTFRVWLDQRAAADTPLDLAAQA